MTGDSQPSPSVLPAAFSTGTPDFDRDVHAFQETTAAKLKRTRGTREPGQPMAADDQRAGADKAKALHKTEWLSGEKTLRVLPMPHIFVVGIVLTVIVTGGGLIGKAFTGGVWKFAPILLLGALTAALSLWFYRRVRIPKAPKEGGPTLGTASDARYRVQLAAGRDLVHALGPLGDDAFEPAVFPVPFALPRRTKWAWIVWSVLSAAGIGGVIIFRHVLHIGRGEPYEYWAAMGLAAAPFAFLWPTYFRVSPGRFDLVRYPMLGAGRPTVTGFDLRRSRVRLHAAGQFLVIETPDRIVHSLHFGQWTPRRLELTRAILQAARWRFDTPALPDDDLVG